MLLALLAAGAVPAFGGEAVRPPALDRPAEPSPKASTVGLLTAARAGARMLAAGEHGVVVYSDDGGRSWVQAQVPTSASLTAMQFIDDREGWAVGHMGVVLHSTDGGRTWTRQLDGIFAAQRVLDAARVSGDTRAIADAERLVADGADKPFFDLLFLDGHRGFVVGAYNLCFRTEDGGATWAAWQSHLSKANPKALHLYGIRAVGSTLFVVGEQGLILRSEDGGERFEPLHSPYAGSWFGLTAAPGSLVAYGLRGNAFRSADGGRSWHKLPTDTPASISAGLQLADGRIVLASQGGDVLVSADQGASFARLPGAAGLPLAGIAEGSGGFVLASLRGVQMLPASKK